MKKFHLKDMKGGWFVGDFHPTVFKTGAAEAAVKSYKKGQREDKHFHKIATEVTLILCGRVLMNGKEFSEGDIVVISPNESVDFVALEDSKTSVVKIPGALNDKYLDS